MKYFFLSEGWTTGRIWEFGGIWDEFSWQRKPHLQQMNLCIIENGERLWLYQVEEAVLMVEVQPESQKTRPIGQVVLKRLITADQVIERLCLTNVTVSANSNANSVDGLESLLNTAQQDTELA